MTRLEKAWQEATRKQRAAAICVLLRADCHRCPLSGKSCIFDGVKEALADWAEEPTK